MAVKELERLRQEAADQLRATQEKNRAAILQLEQQKKDYENGEPDRQKRAQEIQAKLTQFFVQTGVINGFKELQQTKEVRQAVKTAIVINTSKYDERGQATLVWGSKFRVENNEIIHEETGLFKNIWEWDYKFITVDAVLNLYGSASEPVQLVDIKGENLTGSFRDVPPADYPRIQTSLAKAFLNPAREKSRSTPGERKEAAHNEWQRRQDYEYQEKMRNEGH